MNADEIELVIKANIDKLVCVVYADGETEKLFVHTVDDEGFVCDIATEMSEPPPCAYQHQHDLQGALTLHTVLRFVLCQGYYHL